MVSLVRWFSSSKSGSSQTPHENLYERISKAEAANPYIHTLSLRDLQTVREIIDLNHKNDSPLAQKVDNAFRKAADFNSSLEADPFLEDAAFIHQGTLTEEEMIKKVAAEGKNWTQLKLNTLNDELLEIVGTSCPNLRTLVLSPRVDRSIEIILTDKGLKAISQLTQLKEFTYQGWSAPYLSEKGFITLLSNPSIQSNLVTLNLCTFYLTEAIIPVINGMKSLVSLSLYTCFIPSSALQSLQLPSTIEHLNLTQATSGNVVLIDDPVLSRLSTFTSLKQVTLDCLMKCSEAGLIQFLKSLPNLVQFSLKGFTATDTLTASLPANLEHLSLSDCSGVSNPGFGALLPRLTTLFSLTLQKADMFGTFDPVNGFSNSVKLLPRTLKSLYLHAPDFLNSLEGMPPVSYLALEGPGPVNFSAYGEEIPKLPLKTLRLIGCRNFTNQQLAKIASSPLASSLQNLQIVDSPLSPEAIVSLEKLHNLGSLMLSRVGFDEEGSEKLFSSPPLMQRITHLYLNNFVITPEQSLHLKKWPKLLVLFLHNLADLRKGESTNFKVDHIEKMNGILLIFAGNARRPAYSYADFKQAFGT